MPAGEAAVFGPVLVIPGIIFGTWRLPSYLLADKPSATRYSTDPKSDDGIDLLGRTGRPILFGLFLVTWSLFSLAVAAFSKLFPITMFRAFGLHVRVSVDTIAVAAMISLPLYGVAGRSSAATTPFAYLPLPYSSVLFLLRRWPR